MLSLGIVLRSTPRRSISFKRRPLSRKSVLDDAVAPKPRRSTDVVAPLLPPSCSRSGCRLRATGRPEIVVPGERAMSSAVITLLEAPMIPVPVRDAQTSTVGRDLRTALRNSGLGEQRREHQNCAQSRIYSVPMTQTFLRLRSRMRTHRVMTRPDAKDAVRNPGSDARGSRAECRGSFGSHGLRTGIAVTAAKDRSVWTPRPPVG